MWAIISIRVENKPGILFKVTHLFRSRNFNIDSLTVGVMENPEFSKMVITTVGDEKQIVQIVKQLFVRYGCAMAANILRKAHDWD